MDLKSWKAAVAAPSETNADPVVMLPPGFELVHKPGTSNQPKTLQIKGYADGKVEVEVPTTHD